MSDLSNDVEEALEFLRTHRGGMLFLIAGLILSGIGLYLSVRRNRSTRWRFPVED